MNDDFLTRFRKSPRREFSAALYERINTPMETQRKFLLRRFTFAAAICLALFGALLISPSARAALQFMSREIGGVEFVEEEVPSTPLPESQVTIVPQDVLPLSQAREKVDFKISLPTWVPDDFTLVDIVQILHFGGGYTPVEITWTRNDPKVGNILLTVGQPVSWLVNLDHLQEVQINGQPAGLTGGNWNADTGEWSGHDATLTWMKGDVMYRLSSRGLAIEDLIRMAASIP